MAFDGKIAGAGAMSGAGAMASTGGTAPASGTNPEGKTTGAGISLVYSGSDDVWENSCRLSGPCKEKCEIVACGDRCGEDTN